MESSSKHKCKLTQHEEYRKALLLTSELTSVASGASHVHFHHRMKLLEELIDYWKKGEEVGFVDLDEGVCELKHNIPYCHFNALSFF